jgi:Ubiquitin carboxyl-terminal hydrolase
MLLSADPHHTIPCHVMSCYYPILSDTDTCHVFLSFYCSQALAEGSARAAAVLTPSNASSTVVDDGGGQPCLSTSLTEHLSICLIFDCIAPHKCLLPYFVSVTLTTGKYTLMAIISHIGRNTDHGHYVCHIKKDNQWAFFNDEKVTAICA